MQLWPTLGRLVDVNSSPFIVGIFCGPCKPASVEEYLQNFIVEAKVLATDGFEIGGQSLIANISCYICNAPARAYLKQIKTHTGYYGCERCVQKGIHMEGRMTFASNTSEKRTDHVFNHLDHEDHQVRLSPLSELNVGLVSGFVLDSMYLVHLGVVHRLLNRWLKGPRSSKLSNVQIDVVSGKLLQLVCYVSAELARKPRSLQGVDKWKATEFTQFLLYTGIVALKSELREDYYMNFLCLSVSVFILSSPSLLQHYCDYADELLAYFVAKSVRLYGQNFAVYNVHSLTHIAEDARKYGCLDSISGFPCEKFLGRLKKV